MTIIIKTVPHDEQRYPTVGDWQWDKDGNLLITVSEMGNKDYEFLVAFHELIEVMLCKKRDISQEEVDSFDIRYEKLRPANNFDEPGDSISAPYYNEHQFATCLERLMALELGVLWKDYDEKVATL